MRKVGTGLLLFTVTVSIAAPFAWAQAEQGHAKVMLEGCKVTKPDVVLKLVGLKEGEPPDPNALIEKLKGLGFYDDVSHRYEVTAETRVLIITVKEKSYPIPTKETVEALDALALAREYPTSIIGVFVIYATPPPTKPPPKPEEIAALREHVKRHPNDANGWYRLSIALRRSGAKKTSPGELSGSFEPSQIIRTFFGEGSEANQAAKRAIELYRKRLEKEPSNPWVRYRIAELLEDSKRCDQALLELKILHAQHPGFDPLYAKWVSTAALSWMPRLIQDILAGTTKKGEKAVERVKGAVADALAQAQQAIEAGDRHFRQRLTQKPSRATVNEAVRFYESIIPTLLAGLIRQVAQNQQIQQIQLRQILERALLGIELAVSAFPQDAHLQFELAKKQIGMASLGGMIALSAAQVKSDDEDGMDSERGLERFQAMFAAMQQVAKPYAERVVERLKRLEPKAKWLPGYLVVRAQAHFLAKHIEELREVGLKALRAPSADGCLINNFYVVAAAADLASRPSADLEQIWIAPLSARLESGEIKSADGWVPLAKLRMLQAKPFSKKLTTAEKVAVAAQVIPLLEKAVVAEPKHFEANFLLGTMLLKQSKVDAALPYLREAVAIVKPRESEVWWNNFAKPAHYAYGVALLCQGLIEDAIKEMQYMKKQQKQSSSRCVYH